MYQLDKEYFLNNQTQKDFNDKNYPQFQVDAFLSSWSSDPDRLPFLESFSQTAMFGQRVADVIAEADGTKTTSSRARRRSKKASRASTVGQSTFYA